MSCDCQNTECILVYVNDCSSTVPLPLQANRDGVWKIFAEFNGTWIKQAYYFNRGDQLVIDNKLNASYRHLVKIYDPEMLLFNDTCYILAMQLTIDATGTTPPQPATTTTDLTFLFINSPQEGHSGAIDDPIQVAPANTITIPAIAGKTVHNPVYLNNIPVQDMSYNPNTATFDNSQYGGFLTGFLFTITYEK